MDVTEGQVTNVVTVYQLVLVMALLPFSSMGDRIGHRTQYQVGQLVFLLASAATIFVNNFALLLAVRALQALGAAMALSVSAAMLREIYPANRLGAGMGVNSVVVASSAALAPTLGGFIVAYLDWRWVFVAAAPMAVVSLLLGRSLPDPFKQDRKPEIRQRRVERDHLPVAGRRDPDRRARRHDRGRRRRDDDGPCFRRCCW